MTNLKVIQEYQNAIWVEKDLTAIDAYFKSDALIHSPIESTRGITELKNIIAKWLEAFPGLIVTWDDFICEANKVVSRWHATGIQKGEFQGIQPNDRSVNYTGVSIYELSEQKISQYWAFIDLQHIIKQLTK